VILFDEIIQIFDLKNFNKTGCVAKFIGLG
jgi:hypothetical protein